MKKTLVVILVAVLTGALALALPVTAMGQQVNEWSQYQKDPGHTGSMNMDLPATNQVARRTANINARECSQPVVSANKAFVYAGLGGSSGAIYCFDIAGGNELWHTAIEPVSAYESWSSPAVSEGIVYIGSGSKVQALNSSNGKVLWTKDLNDLQANSSIVNGSPVVDGNRLVIADYGNGSGGGCYFCLDVTRKGKLLWKFALDSGCCADSTPCIQGNHVFVGQGQAFGSPKNGKVWCVDKTTGKAVSSWGTRGYYSTVGKVDVTGSVTAFGDFIYFTDFDYGAASAPNCYLYCLGTDTGREAWKTKVYGSDGAPAVVDGLVVTAGQQPAAWPAPGTNWVTAFAADTTAGKNPVKHWTRSGMGGYTMAVCIANGKVAVGNAEESFPPIGTDVYVLDAGSGSTRWHSTEGGGSPVPTPYGLLSIGDGKMITFGNGSLPNGDYYFAEGTTRPGYQEWICLENPTGSKITTSIEYMLTDGGTRKQEVELPARSRTSLNVNSFLGAGLDVSAHVTGNGHFVAERSMYFSAGGLNGGEQVMGATDPGLRFLYAEGTTRDGFQTWLALQNPQDAEANVLITYLYGDGSPPGAQNLTIGARSRQTVDVNAGAGAGKDVSIAVTSTKPIVGERVMYFTYPKPILGALASGVHNCVGVAVAGTSWYFAEGTTRGNFQEYLCLMNPGNSDTTATIRYMKGTGAEHTVTKTLGANSRTTVDVNADVGADQDVSALVTTPEPIVAERPMYFQFMPAGAGGEVWKGGHDSAGAGYAAYKWEFAEGCTRGGFQTFICIANPNSTDVEVDITYYTHKDGGLSDTKTVKARVAANSRQTVRVNDDVGADTDVSMSVACAAPIVVERPMYFNFNGCVDGGVSLGLPGAP